MSQPLKPPEITASHQRHSRLLAFPSLTGRLCFFVVPLVAGDRRDPRTRAIAVGASPSTRHRTTSIGGAAGRSGSHRRTACTVCSSGCNTGRAGSTNERSPSSTCFLPHCRGASGARGTGVSRAASGGRGCSDRPRARGTTCCCSRECTSSRYERRSLRAVRMLPPVFQGASCSERKEKKARTYPSPPPRQRGARFASSPPLRRPPTPPCLVRKSKYRDWVNTTSKICVEHALLTK